MNLCVPKDLENIRKLLSLTNIKYLLESSNKTENDIQLGIDKYL